jgi:hypothetical protein
MHACGDSSHIKPHYDAVKDKSSAGVGTVFKCPPTITSNNWDENDWSKRLTAGLRLLFTSTSLDIEFSADMGLRFRDLVSVSLRAPFDTHCFLFHGAPDILIHRTKAVFPAASTSTSESLCCGAQHYPDCLKQLHSRSKCPICKTPFDDFLGFPSLAKDAWTVLCRHNAKRRHDYLRRTWKSTYDHYDYLLSVCVPKFEDVNPNP